MCIYGIGDLGEALDGSSHCCSQGMWAIDDLFLEVLSEIYEDDPRLFGADIAGASDLPDKFNVLRSCRWGSESRAVAMRVAEADQYVVNRWKRTKESPGTLQSMTLLRQRDGYFRTKKNNRFKI